MLRYWWSFALALGYPLVSQPAFACRTSAPLPLEDIQYANVVVVALLRGENILLNRDWGG